MNGWDQERSHRAVDHAAPVAADDRTPGRQIGSGGLGGNDGAIDYGGAPSVFADFLPSEDGAGLDLGGAFEGIDGGNESAADVAEQGFAGAAQELPYRQQLEQQFGVPLDGVQTYTDGAAARATSRLGAQAYAAGNQVAFASPNPDMSLVAHELTHVLQQTGTGTDVGARGGGGVETAGEPEAERVEAAVRAGRPVRSALDVDPRKVSAQAGARGPGPALKRAGQGPALSVSPSAGLTFSSEGFDLAIGGSAGNRRRSDPFTLWRAPRVSVPTGVPLLFAFFQPAITAGISGGVQWSRNVARAEFQVAGSVGVGLEYGVPNIATIDGMIDARARGRLTVESGRAVEGLPNAQNRNNTSIVGALALDAGISLNVNVLSQTVLTFELGRMEIGSFTGIHNVNGRMMRRPGWQWSPAVQAFLRSVKAGIDRARAQARRFVREGTNWLLNPVGQGLRTGAAAYRYLTGE
jgi:hypothetical protein